MIDKIKEYIGEAQAFSTQNVAELEAFRIKFLGSKGQSSSASTSTESRTSSTEPTPYDFATPEQKTTNVDSNPFADFGSSIEISDDELPF